MDDALDEVAQLTKRSDLTLGQPLISKTIRMNHVLPFSAASEDGVVTMAE